MLGEIVAGRRGALGRRRDWRKRCMLHVGNERSILYVGEERSISHVGNGCVLGQGQLGLKSVRKRCCFGQ